jgi:hypothetical protein
MGDGAEKQVPFARGAGVRIGLGPDWLLRAVHDLELGVVGYTADADGFPGVLIARVDPHQPLGAVVGLMAQGFAYCGSLMGAGFGDRLRPHVYAQIGGLHWIRSYALGPIAVAEGLDKAAVFGTLDTLEVVPGRVVAGDVQVAEFIFSDAEGEGWNPVGRDIGGAQGAEECDVAVAVDCIDD